MNDKNIIAELMMNNNLFSSFHMESFLILVIIIETLLNVP